MQQFPRLAGLVLLLATGALGQQSAVRRFPRNPILSRQLVGDDTAFNFDREGQHTPFISFAGPSLIRVPDWVQHPLGRYYLYFAHHKGGHIRLAYADSLEGPWAIHQPGEGVLRLGSMRGFAQDHVASPDVHVDHIEQRIVMYVHAPVREDITLQRTFRSESTDGLDFQVRPEPLGAAYFRTFRWGGYWYTPSRKGPMYRSKDGVTNFEQGPTLFPMPTRHYAVRVHGDFAYVFFSTINDGPERIKLALIDLREDWSQWIASPPVDVLLPTEAYETSFGARLLDPCIYEESGRFYLLYSVSAERGIAIARLVVPEWNNQNASHIEALSCAPYVVAEEPFGPGVTLWSDRPETALASPAYLLGLPWLRSAHADAKSAEQSAFLGFRLSHPATLYVLHDQRFASLPEWLADWNLLGQSVDLGLPNGLRILSKAYPAGQVVLGGNSPADTPFGSPRFMYSVIVGR